MMIKNIFVLLFVCLSGSIFAQQNINFPEAKFHIGDNQQWKDPNFDDSQWQSLGTTKRWETQGIVRYDGYAWYRIKFHLLSSIRDNAFWKDTLSVLLSKIDDMDETFLNGVKIGQTGLFPSDQGGPIGKWSVPRIYNMKADNPCIRWDQENIIAVRVLDNGDGGGIFGDVPSVRMQMPMDAISLSIQQTPKSANIYKVTVVNSCRKLVDGEWTILIRQGFENKVISTINKKITVNPESRVEEVITVPDRQRVEITASFTEKNTLVSKSVLKVTPYILTPEPSPIPKINNASVVGIYPKTPFLYRIAATGTKPIHYEATNLPEGLTLDRKSGIISGKIAEKGDYKVKLTATNSLGKANKTIVIKAGDLLALTPPMGWNSWYCWGTTVSTDHVKSSAQAMIERGLTDHGWLYVNVDDGWNLPERAADGTIQTNERFPDMKGLGDWLHNNGLLFGMYTSPGPTTCGDYLGSYQHEKQDAETFTQWGVDYLKYDWCGYSDIVLDDTTLVAFKKPYKVMQEALQAQKRSIVYSLCQYGMKDVWKWGAEVGGNCWRTTHDIRDNWQSVVSIGFNNPQLYPYTKPGHWNDPDMLIIGQLGGWANKPLSTTQLLPDEQYSFISLWCLLSSPLLIGCDLAQMDDFTFNLLSNDEVIAIDQDALGKQAQQKIKTDTYQVWAKELEDGNVAVGIFNMSEKSEDISLNLREIGLLGTYTVRDLWEQKDLSKSEKSFSSTIPPHGVRLLKIFK